MTTRKDAETLAREYCNPCLSHNQTPDANSFIAGYLAATERAKVLVEVLERMAWMKDDGSCEGYFGTEAYEALKKYRGENE